MARYDKYLLLKWQDMIKYLLLKWQDMIKYFCHIYNKNKNT